MGNPHASINSVAAVRATTTTRPYFPKAWACIGLLKRLAFNCLPVCSCMRLTDAIRKDLLPKDPRRENYDAAHAFRSGYSFDTNIGSLEGMKEIIADRLEVLDMFWDENLPEEDHGRKGNDKSKLISCTVSSDLPTRVTF